MNDIPQVILFGSIYGDWRENRVIPVLEELGVSYYNPTQKDGWTKESGDREAEVMAQCETIIMVINKELPSFTSLAETGWAALGAAQRGQHFILQVDLDYTVELPDVITQSEEGQRIDKLMKHWAVSSRYMVVEHAKKFQVETLHMVDDLDGVVAKLRDIYAK